MVLQFSREFPLVFCLRLNRSSGCNFGDGAAMSRVVRFSFVVVKNFPPGKILFQLAWTPSERTFFFSQFRDVDDGKQQAAGNNAALGGLKKISLQVVTDCN